MTDFKTLTGSSITGGAQDEQEFFSFGDIAMAPIRGAEGAARDFYGLLDVFTADALPDWDEQRLFGHAESTAGKVATGLMQFAAGFAATGFGIGSVGKGAAALAARGWKSAEGVSKVASGIRSAKSGMGAVGAGLAKGAVTDFAFVNGHEGRLSDAISGTFLENPISRMLESEDSDSELEGRLRNMIEGLGLGALTDTIFHGIRTVSAGKAMARKAKADAEVFLPDGIIQDTKQIDKFQKIVDNAQQIIGSEGPALPEDALEDIRIRTSEPRPADAPPLDSRRKYTVYNERTETSTTIEVTQKEIEAGLTPEAFDVADQTLKKAGFARGVETFAGWVDRLDAMDLDDIRSDPEKFRKAVNSAFKEELKVDSDIARTAANAEVREYGDPEFRGGGQEAVDLIAEAELIHPNPKRKRGADNFFRRLELEANILGGSARDDIQGVRKFMDDLGHQYFDDLGISIHKNLDSAGRYEFGSQIIRIAKRVVARGDLEDVAIHEIWHHLSTNLPAKDVGAVRESYKKALKKEIAGRQEIPTEQFKADKQAGKSLEGVYAVDDKGKVLLGGDDPDKYRFRNEDEWFAETLREITQGRLAFLDNAAPSGTVKRLFQDLGVIFRDLWVYAKSKFGLAGPEQRIFNDFLKGKRLTRQRTGAIDGPGPALMEDAGPPRPSGSGPVPDDARLMNLTKMDSESLPAVIRAMEMSIIGRLRSKGISDKSTASKVLKMMSDDYLDALHATDGDKLTTYARLAMETGFKADADIAEELVNRAAMANFIMDRMTVDFEKMLDELGDPRALLASESDEKLLTFVDAMHNLGTVFEQVGRIRSSFGRGLRGMRHDVRERVAMSFEKSAADKARRALEKEKRLLAAGADGTGKSAKNLEEARRNIIAEWNRVKAELGIAANGSKKVKLNAILNISKGRTSQRPLGRLTEYWMGNLLMGPKTHLVNSISNGLSIAMMPTESALGGVVATARALIPGKNFLRFGTGWDMFNQAIDQTSGIASAFFGLSKMNRDDSVWKHVKNAFVTGESQLTGRAGHELGYNVRKPQLTGESMQSSLIGSMVRGAFGDETGNMISNAFGKVVGGAARVPFRLLSASDELSKQLVTRANLQASFAREGRRAGVDNLPEFIAARMKRAIVDGQAFTRRNLADIAYTNVQKSGRQFADASERDLAIVEEATRLAEEEGAASILNAAEDSYRAAEDRTFQTPLGRDSYIDRIGNALDAAATQVPILRLFVPFIKTPVNLLKYAAKRTPLDPAATLFHNAVAKVKGTGMSDLGKSAHEATRIMATGTEIQKAEVLGRWALGVGTFMGVSKLALNHFENNDSGPDGRKHSVSIVGRGPTDANEKKAWLAAGNQEYSINIGGKAISYQRLDPLATILGMTADLVQFSHFAEGDEAGNAGLAFTFAIANNFTSKSYLQGVQNLLTVMEGEDPDEVGRVLRNMASSFAPGGQAVSQVNSVYFDPEMKEVRTYLDGLYSRYPGLSDQVEARRDITGQIVNRPAWGEPGAWVSRWSPFPVTEKDASDPVNIALAETRHNWTRTPRQQRYNGVKVDLVDFVNESGQTAYDRVQELSGTIQIGDMTMRDRLAKIIESDTYKALNERYKQRPVDDPLLDKRVKLLGGVITLYRSKAKGMVFKEFKDIQKLVEDTRSQTQNPRPKGLF